MRAKRADEGRRQPRKEWANAVKKEEGGQWGRVVSVWASRQAKAQGGERGVGRLRWKERRLRLGRIRSWDRIQKEILFEFQLFLEFGKTLENCTRKFRRKLGIFPKIF
jgi:hypothetical protein